MRKPADLNKPDAVENKAASGLYALCTAGTKSGQKIPGSNIKTGMVLNLPQCISIPVL